MLGRLGVSSPAIARYIRQLARAIAEIQPDVIHANGFKMHLLSAWAAPEACALLWHLHDFIGSRSLMRPLLRIHLRRCATIIANSHSVQRDALATLRAAPIQTIYNGIDLEKFAPHGDQLNLDARTGLSRPDANVMRIGLVANAARWKGHQVFLRALAALPSELLIRGYVIGGPIYQTAGSQFTMDELSRMASELDLEGKVGFTGHLREIPAAMSSLDIVVHESTRPEPFGLVVAEAMATGRPVIASASGGVSELIADGTNALAHQPGDVPGLARAIERLVTDQDLRERLSYEGRRTAEQRFDRRRMGAELAAVYDRLMVRQVRGDDAASAYS
jgi:glycosyltransferase involved in cell wall biosynthesis